MDRGYRHIHIYMYAYIYIYICICKDIYGHTVTQGYIHICGCTYLGLYKGLLDLGAN